MIRTSLKNLIEQTAERSRKGLSILEVVADPHGGGKCRNSSGMSSARIDWEIFMAPELLCAVIM